LSASLARGRCLPDLFFFFFFFFFFFLSIAWLHLKSSFCDEGGCPLQFLPNLKSPFRAANSGEGHSGLQV
jgi:hypothetical protein